MLFDGLKKRYGVRSVRCKGARLRFRSISNWSKYTPFFDHWSAAERFEWPDQPWYTGTGLHYSRSCTVRPLEKQICGNHGDRRDYQDTLSYDQPIVGGMFSGFGPFKAVRCKITCLKPAERLGMVSPPHQGWHRDESPYEVLRVIIPLASDMTYQFQMEDQRPMTLMPGTAYAFDQSRYHRVYSNGLSGNVDRIHLILSFVTWFDHDGSNWVPNRFFNTTHPLDLFDLLDL